MSTSNTTLFAIVSSCYDAAATFAERVVALRERAKSDKVSLLPKEVKVYLMESTARYYGVTLVDKVRGEGQTWGDDKKSLTAKRQNERLADAVCGKLESKGEAEPEVEIPAELLAAAAKLAKLAQAYEGSRSLASKALAHAFSA